MFRSDENITCYDVINLLDFVLNFSFVFFSFFVNGYRKSEIYPRKIFACHPGVIISAKSHANNIRMDRYTTEQYKINNIIRFIASLVVRDCAITVLNQNIAINR